jgi:syringate O-demethylase
MKVMTKVLGKAPPDLKFFNMEDITIAGKKVTALRHGMAGQPGYELFGPSADGQVVLDAIVEAGKDFGLRLVGSRAYSSNTLESGWIPSPMAPIYSGDEKMKKYREWLPAIGFEGNASLGGSYVSSNIDDHYTTPYDLGYGAFVKFDHDFIGRTALEKIAAKPHRIKVTLELNDEDVIRTIASQYGKETERAKYFDFPSAVYSMYPQDKVLSKDGKQVGVSTWVGYSSNERKQLTLAYLDPEFAKPGTEVTFVWGEPDGGSKKPTVESHKQVQIRAIVCPVPYVASVRTGYAEGGWRATGKL